MKLLWCVVFYFITSVALFIVKDMLADSEERSLIQRLVTYL